MSMFNKVSKSFMFGQHEVTLTTGEIARQASGAVVVQMGDTVILATVVQRFSLVNNLLEGHPYI